MKQKIQFTLRISQDLSDKLEAISKERERSRNWLINRILETEAKRALKSSSGTAAR